MGIFNFFKQEELPKPSNSTSKDDIRYLELTLRKWLKSDERDEQLLAEKYYDGDHDILYRVRTAIGPEGTLIPVDNVVNNKLVDNQYRKLVDQKTNYVLGKPITIATSNDKYLKRLNKVFNKKVHRKLRTLAQYAVDGGIAWLYPYYGTDGEFKLAVFPSYEICPIWKDRAHTELDSAMRYYQEEVFDNKGDTSYIEHVDLFTTNGIVHFLYKGGKLTLGENPHTDYVYVDNKGFNWQKLPIIPFKYNPKEIPLIRSVKSLQDAINLILSEFQNNMEENPRNAVMVIKNYDGTDMGTFRHNLMTYGGVKVTTVDGVQGGVETLTVEVNAENYKAILMQLKRAIVENGRGFDAKEERMDGDPNQMNIESMYTDIDLDVNGMETEFQAGFEELKWFVDQYLMETYKDDFKDEEVEFIFNRDIFINEDANIENCVKSVGLISTKTILSRHPWVSNVDHELTQLEEDKEAELEEMEVMAAFQNKTTKRGNNNE